MEVKATLKTVLVVTTQAVTAASLDLDRPNWGALDDTKMDKEIQEVKASWATQAEGPVEMAVVMAGTVKAADPKVVQKI